MITTCALSHDQCPFAILSTSSSSFKFRAWASENESNKDKIQAKETFEVMKATLSSRLIPAPNFSPDVHRQRKPPRQLRYGLPVAQFCGNSVSRRNRTKQLKDGRNTCNALNTHQVSGGRELENSAENADDIEGTRAHVPTVRRILSKVSKHLNRRTDQRVTIQNNVNISLGNTSGKRSTAIQWEQARTKESTVEQSTSYEILAGQTSGKRSNAIQWTCPALVVGNEEAHTKENRQLDKKQFKVDMNASIIKKRS
jgi:hypothetical protein